MTDTAPDSPAPAPDSSAPVPPTTSSSDADALGDRLNWLRAGVLGANDGIVSTAGLIVGVAAARTVSDKAILVTAVAGVIAASVSMALGEYVSVSTQRDMERSMAAADRASGPEGPVEMPSAWHAAGASALSFVCGALIPTVAMLVSPTAWRIPATFVAVIAALAATGYVSATLGRSPRTPAVVRVVIGGAIAMGLTWAAGTLFGAS